MIPPGESTRKTRAVPRNKTTSFHPYALNKAVTKNAAAATGEVAPAAEPAFAKLPRPGPIHHVNPGMASYRDIKKLKLDNERLRRSTRLFNRRAQDTEESTAVDSVVLSPSITKTTPEQSNAVQIQPTPLRNQLKKQFDALQLTKTIKAEIAIASTVPQPTTPQDNSQVDSPDGHLIIKTSMLLGERYTLESQLGQGTFGKVVKAFDMTKSRPVAVKIIKSIKKYRRAAESEIRILNYLKHHDPLNLKKCIYLLDTFEHMNHICMSFPLLGSSLFDFMKSNHFLPFSMAHVKSFARQIIRSVAYIHSHSIIHTDLKPENLMLMDCRYKLTMVGRSQTRLKKELLSTDLQLIDFGSAIFSHEFHSPVVSTRHYRAPEIILSMGWSFPCDMWSIGCILIELYTGQALFQTHSDLEHLAIMQKIIGDMPIQLTSISKFHTHNHLNVPTKDTTEYAHAFVNSRKTLEQLVILRNRHDRQFLDLLKRLLTYDPNERMNVLEALEHPFVKED